MHIENTPAPLKGTGHEVEVGDLSAVQKVVRRIIAQPRAAVETYVGLMTGEKTAQTITAQPRAAAEKMGGVSIEANAIERRGYWRNPRQHHS